MAVIVIMEKYGLQNDKNFKKINNYNTLETNKMTKPIIGWPKKFILFLSLDSNRRV